MNLELNNRSLIVPETEAQTTFGVESARKAIETAVKQLSDRFDEENGGFSSAPKFPRVSEINLVLLQQLISVKQQQDSDAGDKPYLYVMSTCMFPTVFNPAGYENHLHARISTNMRSAMP